jgi:serine/threonine protein kinase
MTQRDHERIGPYRVLELIGEGGFARVYAAQQEAPVRRRVAIKLLKPGVATAQVIRRFEAEGQHLASMEHPAIARMFDAGTTDDGRPYFIMEYVRGVTTSSFAGKAGGHCGNGWSSFCRSATRCITPTSAASFIVT